MSALPALSKHSHFPSTAAITRCATGTKAVAKPMRRSRRAASGVHPPGKLDRMFAPGLCRLDVPATIDLSVCAIAASSSGCGPPSPVATPKLARLPSSHMERQYLSSRANRVMHARAQTRAHVRTRRRRGAVSRRRRYHTLAAFSWTGYCASAGLQHLASTVRSAGGSPGAYVHPSVPAQMWAGPDTTARQQCCS